MSAVVLLWNDSANLLYQDLRDATDQLSMLLHLFWFSVIQTLIILSNWVES